MLGGAGAAGREGGAGVRGTGVEGAWGSGGKVGAAAGERDPPGTADYQVLLIRVGHPTPRMRVAQTTSKGQAAARRAGGPAGAGLRGMRAGSLMGGARRTGALGLNGGTRGGAANWKEGGTQHPLRSRAGLAPVTHPLGTGVRPQPHVPDPVHPLSRQRERGRRALCKATPRSHPHCSAVAQAHSFQRLVAGGCAQLTGSQREGGGGHWAGIKRFDPPPVPPCVSLIGQWGGQAEDRRGRGVRAPPRPLPNGAAARASARRPWRQADSQES